MDKLELLKRVLSDLISLLEANILNNELQVDLIDDDLNIIVENIDYHMKKNRELNRPCSSLILASILSKALYEIKKKRRKKNSIVCEYIAFHHGLIILNVDEKRVFNSLYYTNYKWDNDEFRNFCEMYKKANLTIEDFMDFFEKIRRGICLLSFSQRMSPLDYNENQYTQTLNDAITILKNIRLNSNTVALPND